MKVDGAITGVEDMWGSMTFVFWDDKIDKDVLYVVGSADSAMAGAHKGLHDIVVYKLDRNGTVLAKTQIGTARFDTFRR